MKKRIFAVIGIVLMLVPLCILGVSADEADGKTAFIQERHGGYVSGQFEAVRNMVDTFSSYLKDIKTIFYTRGDESDMLSCGDEVLVSQRYIRDMKEGYTLNVLLGKNAIWCVRVQNPGGKVTLCGGVGDIYVTYRYDGQTDICFFNTKKIIGGHTFGHDRVRLLFKGDTLSNTQDGNNTVDHLVLDSFDFRLFGLAQVISTKNAKLIDLAIGFADQSPVSFPYLLETLTAPVNAQQSAVHWDYIDQAYQEYSLGYDKGNLAGYDNGYHKGFAEGVENGEEQGYDSGYYYGLADGKIKGEAIGYDKGYVDGEHDGMKAGLERGWDEGHETGYIEGAQYSTDMGSMFFSILEAPIVLIDGMLNFDFFGINVAGLVKTLLTLSITAAIVFFIFKLVRG